jgi:hypothetical protein
MRALIARRVGPVSEEREREREREKERDVYCQSWSLYTLWVCECDFA